ncbi:MAG: CinA family protein [Burkholderiaceae bacterium]
MSTKLTELTTPLAAALIQRKQTVAVAESSTGGLISASLLAVPGASAYYVGGSVIYTARSRKQVLGVTPEDVADLEPLTEAMALAFARVARRQLNSTWAISELGIAGPTPARYGHAPGTSAIGISGPVERATIIETGSNDREENMWAFTRAAIALLNEVVAETD